MSAGKRKPGGSATIRSTISYAARLFIDGIVVALAAAVPAVARADQKDPRLDALFAELQKATGTLQGRTLTQQIWAIWIASDNPEVNRLMSEGTDAMAMQDYKTALADFTRMITIAPDFAEGWNKRATVLWLLGDFEGSMADVDRRWRSNSRHFGALWGLRCHGRGARA
jgi:Flp pilus assembly protein TadD